MVAVKSSTDALPARRRDGTSDGVTAWFTPYIGFDEVQRGRMPAPEFGALFPIAFLVEQDTDTELQPHFHRANQFQVFVAGRGFFAGAPVQGVTVHYAHAYTAYGPLTSRGAGLAYFTLRNGWDDGPHFMPEKRALLREQPRVHREAASEALPLLPPSALARLTAVSSDAVLAPEADGLGGWLHQLPPGGTVTGGAPAQGAGQWWLTLSGTVDAAGRSLEPQSCIFVAPTDEALTVTAGPQGGAVLALQFPH